MNGAWRLDGKRALITGASRGLGKATALEMAGLGAELVLVARGAAGLAEVAGQVRDLAPGCQVTTVAADLASEAGRDTVVSAALSGGLQVLVNNVGTNIRKPMTEVALEEFRLVQETNIVSCFEMCRRLFPALKAGAPASVVNNASVAGIMHLRTGASYAMSKAAMIQLTRNLAVEWAQYDIRVNAVAPWYIDTPLARQVLDDDAYLAEVLDRTPMGRVGDPSEVARVISFLCMEGAGYITGQCLPIDGGFSVYGF
jgi:Tropinone reductase 1